MAASRCPLCGYQGGDFPRNADGRLVCPRCGEVAGEAGATPIDVAGRTLTVGTALAGVGGMTLIGAIAWLAVVLLVGPPPPAIAAGGNPQAAEAARFGYYAGQYGPGIAGIAIGLVVTPGGIQLARRRMWPLAVLASLTAMIPCSCGVVVGLPIAIWALVVLFNPTVRAAFR